MAARVAVAAASNRNCFAHYHYQDGIACHSFPQKNLASKIPQGDELWCSLVYEVSELQYGVRMTRG